ncbi:hypothetical protein Syun_001138 [Stephania yunnanensis]|uniref:Uncharacterized protein n=1 Tax=Stephania yunnanensis TaxID=152371 RepID=A0AAP0Q6T8_9MAGN
MKELRSEMKLMFRGLAQMIEELFMREQESGSATQIRPQGGGYTPDPPDPPQSGEFDPSAESSVRRGQSYRSGSEVRKIKMPTCDGENPLVWLNQAEHYFALHEMSELSKLRAARICLIGLLRSGYRTRNRRRRSSGGQSCEPSYADDLQRPTPYTFVVRSLLSSRTPQSPSIGRGLGFLSERSSRTKRNRWRRKA